MRHFLIMGFYAIAVGIVFGLVGRDTTRERWRYGGVIFLQFVAVGLGLAWLLYFLPL